MALGFAASSEMQHSLEALFFLLLFFSFVKGGGDHSFIHWALAVKAEKECARGRVMLMVNSSERVSLLNSFQKQGPADRSFLLFAPTCPSPPPTSAPAPLAPRGSQASKRKFLIGHYITGGLATAAACPGSTSGALSISGAEDGAGYPRTPSPRQPVGQPAALLGDSPPTHPQDRDEMGMPRGNDSRRGGRPGITQVVWPKRTTLQRKKLRPEDVKRLAKAHWKFTTRPGPTGGLLRRAGLKNVVSGAMSASCM